MISKNLPLDSPIINHRLFVYKSTEDPGDGAGYLKVGLELIRPLILEPLVINVRVNQENWNEDDKKKQQEKPGADAHANPNRGPVPQRI